MRLAFLTSLVPGLRPTSGYEVANACVIDGLRSLGHEVFVQGWALPETEVPTDPHTICFGKHELRNARASRAAQIRWLARAYASRLPFAAAKLLDLPDRAFRIDDVDAVVFNSWQVATAFPDLRKRKPWAYLAHNVEQLTSRENARFARSGVERRLHARDAKLLEIIERDLVADARFVWALTADDLETLGAPIARGASLPLLLPKPDAPTAPVGAFDAAMIGTFTWEPNAVGLRWLLGSVLPHLPPDFTLAVAGDAPADLVRARPNVRWMGRVDDAAAFLAQGRVVPLVARAGTGLQLKTVEVLQSGLAAVATAPSLRGIDERPANVRVADDAREFALALADFATRGRAGDTLRVDPTPFIERQEAGLKRELHRGIEALAA